jgi:uncharacterized membrane protein
VDDLALARALHVLGVIHWIGGLAFVTLIVLPLARSRPTAEEALAVFAGMERRFSAQVRVSVPLVGATGLWMTYGWDLWDRFHDPHFWWMTAMFTLWLVFMLMLFVIEPLVHAGFEKKVRQDPAGTFRRMNRLHQILLLLTALTAFGAVAGAHGLIFF